MVEKTEAKPRYSEVVARLAGAQKSNKGAPPYSRFINRPFGRRVAAAAYLMGWTPNQVTAVSATLSVVGVVGIVVLPTAWWAGVIIGASLVLAYAFDAADGQLARLTGGGSVAGEWLDHIVDAFKTVCLHQGVLLACLWGYADDRRWLYVAAAHTVVAVVHFFAQLLNDALRREQRARAGGGAPPAASSSVLRSLLAAPMDYGTLCVLFFFWGWPLVFLGGYFIMTVATAAYLGLALVKWYRDMCALDQA